MSYFSNPIAINIDGTTAATPVKFSSIGTVGEIAVKASAGRLIDVFAVNMGAEDCYLQFHDAAAIPAEGSTPNAVRPMAGKPADAISGGILKEENPVFEFTTGCQIVWSSTAATYTAIAPGDIATKIINGSYV